MRGKYQEIICILDRSGSMESIRDDAIGGFNTFIESQKSGDDPARVSLFLFDDRFETLFEDLPIEMVRPLTRDTFVPRGSTALLDAVGRTVEAARSRIATLATEEHPEGVVVCVLTDGMENSSHRFRYHDVANLVATCRDELGWEFVFLAANQDAIAEASKLSIHAADAARFDATPDGTVAAFAEMGQMVTERRGRLRR